MPSSAFRIIRTFPVPLRRFLAAASIGVLAASAAASGMPDDPPYAAMLPRNVQPDDAPDQVSGMALRLRHYGVPGASVAVVQGCRIVDANGFGRTSDRDAPVTVRQLLTHGAGPTADGSQGSSAGAALPTLVQTLDGVPPANTDPVRMATPPRVEWRHSGGGFILLQLEMQDATGKSFLELIRENALARAGMADIGYEPPRAAAGEWTTRSDLARLSIQLVRSLRGGAGALLVQDTARGMISLQMGDWGLGVQLAQAGVPRDSGHTRARPGYRTVWLMFPDACQGVVIMTNGDEGKLRFSSRAGGAQRVVAAAAHLSLTN